MDSLLLEPFRADFMQNGALAAIFVGILCGTVGCFVVMRGSALLAESVAHGVLPGVAVAVLLTAGSGEDPDRAAVLAGGLAGGLATAGGTRADPAPHAPARGHGHRGDVRVHARPRRGAHLERVAASRWTSPRSCSATCCSVPGWEVALTGGLAAAVLGLLYLLYRPFVLVSFDRRRAASLGVPVERTELFLMLLLALAVVVGFTVVGALLVLGLLIAPPAAAALVTKRLPVDDGRLRGDRRRQRAAGPADLLALRGGRRRLDRAGGGGGLRRYRGVAAGSLTTGSTVSVRGGASGSSPL